MNKEQELLEIKNKLFEILNQRIEKAYSFNFNSFQEFESYYYKESKNYDLASQNYRLIKTPILEEDIPKYGSIMSLSEFVSCCKDGGFIDYDGSGEYIRDGKMSGISIYPSDITSNRYRKDFTEIIWFNK